MSTSGSNNFKKKKIGKHISHITLLEYLLMAIMVKDTIKFIITKSSVK